MVGHQERSTMAELRWIMMSSFLMLVFNSKATGEYSSITVRDGDKATLPCELEHNDCSSVTWLFSSSGKTTPLYESGKIHKDSRDKSKRLNVTEKCSLIIKNIMMVDVGRYACRYFGSGNIPDTVLDLNVVTMTEQTVKDTVTFTCSVSTDDGCRHTVKWLYGGHEEAQRSCSDSVTFTPSDLSQTGKELSCSVTDDHTKEEHVFTFRLSQSSAATTQTPTSTPTPTPTSTPTPTPTSTPTPTPTSTSTSTPKSPTSEGTNKTASENNQNASKQQGVRWYIPVFVGVATLFLITAALVAWKKTKGTGTRPKTNKDDNEANPEDGVSYVSVNFTKKTKNKARAPAAAADDAVTYSTVNAPSSSAAASADHVELYATVNKPSR